MKSFVLPFRFAILAFAAGGLVARAADQVRVTSPWPIIAAFAGEETALPLQIENRGGSLAETKLFTRLWQMSSATLAPLGEAAAFWSGRVEAGARIDARANLQIPDLRTATRLQLQILDASQTTVTRLAFVAIPRKWLREELSALPVPPGLHDPRQQLAPAFKKLGIEFTPLHGVAQVNAFSGPVLIVIPVDNDLAVLAESVQRLARGGRAVVFLAKGDVKARAALAGGFIAEDCDFAESAPAQFELVQWLRDALHRKRQVLATQPSASPP